MFVDDFKPKVYVGDQITCTIDGVTYTAMVLYDAGRKGYRGVALLAAGADGVPLLDWQSHVMWGLAVNRPRSGNGQLREAANFLLPSAQEAVGFLRPTPPPATTPTIEPAPSPPPPPPPPPPPVALSPRKAFGLRSLRRWSERAERAKAKAAKVKAEAADLARGARAAKAAHRTRIRH